MHFIPDKPILSLDNALIIGDLHIGIEQELTRKGVRLPSLTKQMLEEITSVLKQTKAKRLIILGDLKHSIARINPQEAKEIPLFLSAIESKTKLSIVLGNHDGGLKPYLKDFEVHDARGFVYKKNLLFHGNAKPKKADLENSKQLIASHWHPIFAFKDSLGGRVTEKIWVEASAFDKPLLIIPSFNKLLGGIPLDKIDDKWLDLEEAKMTMLDGTYLGEFKKENDNGK